MRKSQFSKHINQLTEEELKGELIQLFSKVPEVKKYYAMELGDEQERKKLYAKAKKDIAAKYATKSLRKPRRPRIQKVNRILSEMKKASIFAHEMADLYLFDVETAMIFAIKYGYFSKVLAHHILNTFRKAIAIIDEQKLESMFGDRCKQIVERSLLIPEIHSDLRMELRKLNAD